MSLLQTEPATGFTRFHLSPEVQRGIAAAGFIEPRPIQARTIPAALEGRDILGLARTGTGKTAAFALPLIERLLRHPGSGPRVLIVAPTRELVTQIATEIRLLARFTRLRVATVFGGVSMQAQRTALKARPEIVVACPGRLLDLFRQGAVRLDAVESLVLDEADHMFDMGFLPDIRRILAALPQRRQNLLFSATMPGEIRGLADRILTSPLVVELDHTTPVPTIEHALYVTNGARKVDLLEHLLGGDGFTSAIVFTRTKHRAKQLARQLVQAGRRAVALQGGMSQGQRDRAMEGFRKSRFDILVATDIAARGIDVDGISHVVNFDVPVTPDAYTHRIGRTGRSDREGTAFTFATPEDMDLVQAIERRIGRPIPRRMIGGRQVPATGSSPAAPVVALSRPRRTSPPRRPARVGRFRGSAEVRSRRRRTA